MNNIVLTLKILRLIRRYDDLSVYPIMLMYEELSWKLSVGIDLKNECYTLDVNQVSVHDLPYIVSLSYGNQ